MKFQTQIEDDRLIVTALAPRIDAAAAIQFKDRMRELIAEPTPRVVLDLSHVEFLDSSGLGAVVAVMKMLAPERKLELAQLNPGVAKVFHLTRMDRVFTIHEKAASVDTDRRDEF